MDPSRPYNSMEIYKGDEVMYNCTPDRIPGVIINLWIIGVQEGPDELVI